MQVSKRRLLVLGAALAAASMAIAFDLGAQAPHGIGVISRSGSLMDRRRRGTYF